MYNDYLEENLRKTKEFLKSNRKQHEVSQLKQFYENERKPKPQTFKREKAIKEINAFKTEIKGQFTLLQKLRDSDQYQKAMEKSRPSTSTTSRVQTATSMNNNPYSDISYLKDTYLDYSSINYSRSTSNLKNMNKRPMTANTVGTMATRLTENEQDITIHSSTKHTIINKKDRITFSRMQRVRSSVNVYNMYTPTDQITQHHATVPSSLEKLEGKEANAMDGPEDDPEAQQSEQLDPLVKLDAFQPTPGQVNFREEILDLANKLEEKQEDAGINDDRMKQFADVFIFEDAQMEEEFNTLRKHLGMPTARVEVKSLIKWLNESLQDLMQNQGRTVKDLFLNSMIIYEKCFHEIVRQVSVHCVERGYLVHRVWNAYVVLFRKMVEMYEYDVKQIDDTYQERSMELEDLYVKKNEERDHTVSILENKLTSKTADYNKMKEEFYELQSKYKHSVDQMQNVKVDRMNKVKKTQEKAKKEFEEFLETREQNKDSTFISRSQQMKEMRNKVKNNQSIAADVFSDQCIQAGVYMKSRETNTQVEYEDSEIMVGNPSRWVREGGFDTSDLVELVETAVGKDAKPGAKNLMETIGQLLPENSMGTHVNTIYDEKSEVINLKEMNVGLTGDFKNYKDVIAAMKEEYEKKIAIMEKDIEFGKKQLINYKEEANKLKQAKKVLLDTLKKYGIEVPASLLSGKDGELSDKDLSDIMNKIDNVNNKSNQLTYHTKLDPSDQHQNHERVLYYTINAHKLEAELQKSFSTLDKVRQEKGELDNKNKQLTNLVQEMMEELQRVQQFLTVTKNVKDKGVSVDTFMDDYPKPVTEIEPYEIKINIQKHQEKQFSAPAYNHQVSKKMQIMYPNVEHRNFSQESSVLQMNRQKNVHKSKMHLASSLVYSLKIVPIKEIVQNKNVLSLNNTLRSVSKLMAERITMTYTEEMFSHYIFNNLYAKFGLKDLTESKFIALLSSVIRWKENYRICNFGYLLGLFGSWDEHDQTNYLLVLDKLSCSGSNYDVEDNVYVTIHQAKRALDGFFSENSETYEYEMIEEIVTQFQTEVTSVEGPVVNIDRISYHVTELLQGLKSPSSDWHGYLFDAFDVKNDGFMEHYYFDILLRHYETERYKPDLAFRLTKSYYESQGFEMEDPNQMVLNKAIFKEICIDNGLILSNKRPILLQCNNSQSIAANVAQLIETFKFNSDILKSTIHYHSKDLIEITGNPMLLMNMDSWMMYMTSKCNYYKDHVVQILCYTTMILEIEHLFEKLNLKHGVFSLKESINFANSTLANYTNMKMSNVRMRLSDQEKLLKYGSKI